MKTTLWVILWAAIGINAAEPPITHGARSIPTEPRKLVIWGRNLWVGNEWDASKPTAKIGGQSLEFFRDGSYLGANPALVPADEPNRALPEVLQFTIPAAIQAAQGVVVDLVRNDGQAFQAAATIGERAKAPAPIYFDPFDASGEVIPLSEPREIRSEFNGQGATFVPGPGFVGNSLLIVRSGGIRNAGVVVLPSADGKPINAIEIDAAAPVTLERVLIRNDREAGVGLTLTNCTGSTFAHVVSEAATPFSAGPTAKHGLNTFLACKARPGRFLTGRLGRAWLGDRNLVYACEWSGLDRGPVGQQAGPPLWRTLLYRCVGTSTGLTIGGSENILWEAISGGLRVEAMITGDSLWVDTEAALTLTPDVKPGRFVCVLDGSKKWGRIVESKVENGNLYVKVDRHLAGSTRLPVFIGPCIAENTVALCVFKDAKHAIYQSGRAMGNTYVGCQCRNVADCVVIIEKDVGGLLAFDWGGVRRHCFGFNCGRELVRTDQYYDATKPPSQLPWRREIP